MAALYRGRSALQSIVVKRFYVFLFFFIKKTFYVFHSLVFKFFFEHLYVENHYPLNAN